VTDDPGSPPGGEPELTSEEALRRLEQRLNRASEAAERLIIEAAARAAGEGGGEGSERAGSDPPSVDPARPPPAGWQRPDPRESGAGAAGDSAAATGRGELDLLVAVLNAVRDRIPPELQRRLGEAFREVLLAVRAVIDWYLERTERRRTESTEVQDIPIL
jgi:hypothetical protein